MNEISQPAYPTVQIRTPMPAGAPTTLVHRGLSVPLPAKFDHASTTYLLSLFDYSAACRLCDGEHFEALVMTGPDREKRAVGYVSVVEYHQTEVGPYREWILGIWVAPRGANVPNLRWVNPTSLAFYGVPAGDQGFTFYAPKMFLTEKLPIDVGVEHYAIPKEPGEVIYDRSTERTRMEVRDSTGTWIMNAAVPNTRGLFARWRLGLSVLNAFGWGPTMGLVWMKEVPVIMAGSAKLGGKNAFAVSRVDPRAEFLLWNDGDCQLAVNADSAWGKVLRELAFSPSLICHIPNLSFVLSGPMDQEAKL